MIWFAESYRWTNGTTWLGVMNPLRTAQDVRVELLGPGTVRTLTLAPRSRQSVELGTWGVTGDFGVEVSCGSVCAASLVMWDRQMTTAHESIPLVGCEVR